MLKGNRTRLVGTFISILGLLEVYGREMVPTQYEGWLLFGVGVAMIILRQFTTTPPGKKG